MKARSIAGRFAALPLLASPFRVFNLLGALNAPMLAIGGMLAYGGVVDLQSSGGLLLWHGHEMLFGFGGAIVIGTVLTALPSWAGIDEWHGASLAGLALAWLLRPLHLVPLAPSCWRPACRARDRRGRADRGPEPAVRDHSGRADVLSATSLHSLTALTTMHS